jgi:deoxyuridine 5'-triphosphate nucleotidohydrolase
MEKIRMRFTDPTAQTPVRGSALATGYDLTATGIYKETDIYIMYNTNVQIQPENIDVDIQIRPRSSVYKTGMALANSLGTIDADYEGNLMVVFYKAFSTEETRYKIGDRIAQLVCGGFYEMDFVEEDFVGLSGRGDGGFGSTDIPKGEIK